MASPPPPPPRPPKPASKPDPKKKELLLKMMEELKGAEELSKKIHASTEAADKFVDPVEKENK